MNPFQQNSHSDKNIRDATLIKEMTLMYGKEEKMKVELNDKDQKTKAGGSKCKG